MPKAGSSTSDATERAEPHPFVLAGIGLLVAASAFGLVYFIERRRCNCHGTPEEVAAASADLMQRLHAGHTGTPHADSPDLVPPTHDGN